jgi:hypothetical protein
MKHPKMGEIANEFASSFSSFEYALKASGCCSSRRMYDRDIAQVDWSEFMRRHAGAVQLLDQLRKDPVASYIVTNPPRYRTLNKLGEFGWDEPEQITTMSDLCNAVKRARNNLFHGDKANWDASRDDKLLRASIKVIDCLLELAPEVKQHFEIGIMLFCSNEQEATVEKWASVELH